MSRSKTKRASMQAQIAYCVIMAWSNRRDYPAGYRGTPRMQFTTKISRDKRNVVLSVTLVEDGNKSRS